MANPVVTITMDNGDVIKAELYPEIAPNTVNNFISLVKRGFYDGLIFHRVIKGFMVQGGGMDADMREKQTRDTIENEAANGLKNDKYSIAMARTSAPHSASAQFFINTTNNDFLNFKAPNPQGFGYAVFGKVVEGFDVVDQIEGVKTGNKGFHQDVPKDAVVITKAEIV